MLISDAQCFNARTHSKSGNLGTSDEQQGNNDLTQTPRWLLIAFLSIPDSEKIRLIEEVFDRLGRKIEPNELSNARQVRDPNRKRNEAICQKWLDGKGDEEIGREYHLSAAAVRKVRYKLGVKARTLPKKVRVPQYQTIT